MATSLLITMAAGETGAYSIRELRSVRGEPPRSLGQGVPPRLALFEGHASVLPGGTHFALRGSTGVQRYTTRSELDALNAVQPALGRAEASSGAMIALRKSEAWWQLAQDERRSIFEERSHHIASSMHTLPAIARRLYHARELGEPYDFLTWFEFAPAQEPLFDALLAQLRASEEWSYVERELELRLTREG